MADKQKISFKCFDFFLFCFLLFRAKALNVLFDCFVVVALDNVHGHTSIKSLCVFFSILTFLVIKKRMCVMIYFKTEIKAISMTPTRKYDCNKQL